MLSFSPLECPAPNLKSRSTGYLSENIPLAQTRPTLLLVVVCLVLSGLASGQRASIQGAVTDQSGGLVPGVHITLLNLDQGLKRDTLTNDEGYFAVPFLLPGRYLVTAQKDGFAIAEISDLLLHVGDVRGLSIRLHVGAPPVQVQVSGQASLVDTFNPTLSQVVTGDVVRNAPLNGRDIRDLALLQPGVTPADQDSRGAGTFNIVGNRSDSVNYLLDGGLNNDLIDNRVVYTPNPDAVAEFRILTSNYPAEYGRNSGGVITVATRSGTNQYHGSLFDFLRNDALNANSFFNNNQGFPRQVLKRNQFGGTLGGPIPVPHTDKAHHFFFVGYQGQREVQEIPSRKIATFTPAELGGDFSTAAGGSPDPGVASFLQAFPFFQPNPALASQAIIDPTRINSVAQNYIAAGLIPTSPSGELNSQQPVRLSADELTTKLDFDLTANNKLGITLGWDRVHQVTPFDYANVPGYPDILDAHDYFLNIAHTHIFSTDLINELKITAERSYNSAAKPAVRLPTPGELGIGITPDLPTGPTNLLFDTGLQIGFSPIGPQRLTDNTFSYADTLTWLHGSHSWKFGGGFSAFQNNTLFAFTVNGQFVFGFGQNGSGNSFADFLLGLPLQYGQSANAYSNVRSKFMYGFAQDEWRVRKNLVLSLGARYEYATPKADTQGRTFSVIPGQQSDVFPNAPPGLLFPGDAGAPRGVNFPDRNDWAARLGFAWDPKGQGRTSLRGAFGIFYDILKAEDNLQFNGQAPFYSSAGLPFGPLTSNPTSEVNYLTQPFVAAGVPDPFPSRPPSPNIDFGTSGFLPIGASGSTFLVDPHLRTPYTYQYHLTLQHQVAERTVLEASYVGSSSHGLTALVDINPFVLGTCSRVLNPGPRTTDCSMASFPNYAALLEFRNVSNASYNALLLSLQKQFSGSAWFGRSYFTLAYSYSHNIDDASGFQNRNTAVPFYDTNLFRASADMDIRHRIVFSGGWELPVDQLWASGPSRATRGWNVFPILSWRTGSPLDVFANFPAFDFTSPGPSGAGDPGLVRANLVAPVRILDPRQGQQLAGEHGNFWFDPNSFDRLNFPSDQQAVDNPAVRTYGSLSRNYFRGPGRFNIDLAFAKDTPITDRIHMEVRADFFNILNHAQFANPDTSITSTTFGQVLYTTNPRTIQMALRLSF